MEARLIHDGDVWIAACGGVSASGRTLRELDDALAKSLAVAHGGHKRRVTVFMGFDYSTMPVWLRQYTYHYFNRWVTLDLPEPSDIGELSIEADGR